MDNIIKQWLEEEEEEELIEGVGVDSDEELETDHVEEQCEESNTEQEYTDDEYEGESTSGDDIGSIVQNKYYIGKDQTKWKKKVPPQNSRTRSHNIITHLPGPKSNAKNKISHMECFSLFFDDSVILIITKSTNIKIQVVQNKYSRERDAKETDETEIRAVIGILILAGVSKSGRQNILKLFDDTKGTGIETIYLAMSSQRFSFLMRNLRFDNFTDREQRREIDKLAAIRELFEIILQNFQTNFIPSEYLTIDEQLIAFRGRCSFRQYIPSKPARYGIKIFALVDVKNAYTYNLEVYVGTQPDGPYKINNSPNNVVTRLVQPIEGTKRNITIDNWFTSLPLVLQLLEDKKLTVVGTMRRNKTCIPKQFVDPKNRPINSSLFGFHKDCTLTSYVPKKNKVVIAVSTLITIVILIRQLEIKKNQTLLHFIIKQNVVLTAWIKCAVCMMSLETLVVGL